MCHDVKFYPYEKGGGGKSFSRSEGVGGGGWHKRFWDSFFSVIPVQKSESVCEIGIFFHWPEG